MQLHVVEKKQRPKREQIPRGFCTPEGWLDRLSRNAQATNWIDGQNGGQFKLFF